MLPRKQPFEPPVSSCDSAEHPRGPLITLQDGVRFRPAAIVATGPTATAIEGLL